VAKGVRQAARIAKAAATSINVGFAATNSAWRLATLRVERLARREGADLQNCLRAKEDRPGCALVMYSTTLNDPSSLLNGGIGLAFFVAPATISTMTSCYHAVA
jgi:hypothetical protein